MNRIDQERIERRIRSLEEMPYCPTDKRIEEIKQRAFEEYEQLTRAKRKNALKSKRRSILHCVKIFSALVVFLLMGSFAYSVLTPVTISNANSFVRRAFIWINNQMNLGITFLSPIDDANSEKYDNTQTIQSILELQNVTSAPIIYIPESDDLQIKRINLIASSPNQKEINIWYATIDNKTIVIRNVQTFEGSAIRIGTKSLNTIETSVGKVYTWTDGAYSYAYFASQENIMYASASLPIGIFEQYVSLLSFIN